MEQYGGVSHGDTDYRLATRQVTIISCLRIDKNVVKLTGIKFTYRDYTNDGKNMDIGPS
jgi:hypothetical protein